MRPCIFENISLCSFVPFKSCIYRHLVRKSGSEWMWFIAVLTLKLIAFSQSGVFPVTEGAGRGRHRVCLPAVSSEPSSGSALCDQNIHRKPKSLDCMRLDTYDATGALPHLWEPQGHQESLFSSLCNLHILIGPIFCCCPSGGPRAVQGHSVGSFCSVFCWHFQFSSCFLVLGADRKLCPRSY